MNHLGLREYIFLLLLFVVPVGVYFMVFQPRTQARKAMNEDIQLKQQQLEQLGAARARASSNLTEEIAKLKQALEVARSRQPSPENNTRLLGAFKRLAEANQMVSSIDNEPPPPVTADGPSPIEQNYIIRRVKMNLSGPFMNFYSFLQQVEDQPRLTQITDMSITRDGRQREGVVNVRLSLTVFYLKNESPN